MKLIKSRPFYKGTQVKLFTMDNDLQVLLCCTPVSPVIAYQTWFRVGSRHEKQGKLGIAHLFEHLMFNETKNLPHGVFDRTIEKEGGRTNAGTWVDWTYYQNDLPSHALELIIQLEAERMENLVLQKPQLESEREVVLNERRLRVDDDIHGFISEQLFLLAFDKHPYRFPTIGFEEDIRSINLEDAKQFYKTYYSPNNAHIVLVGDFDEEKALSLIQKNYAHLAKQSLPSDIIPEEPAQQSYRRAVFSKPTETDKVVLGYKIPGVLHEDHLALEFLSDLLFGGAVSRFYREFIIQKELLSSIASSVTPWKDPGLLEIGATLSKNRSAEEFETEYQQSLYQFLKEGPLDSEIERTKAAFLTQFFCALRSCNQKATSIGQYHATWDDFEQLFEIENKIQNLTASYLHDVAVRYFREENLSTIVVKPTDLKANTPQGYTHE